MLGGRRPAALPRGWVVLHQVGMGSGGAPVDSVRTDPAGHFRLRIPRYDSTAVYLVAASYGGIAYFSAPLRVGTDGHGPLSARTDTLLVYDTTSGPPQIGVARRLITVAKVSKDGTHSVLEIVQLLNPGFRTRIAVDTVRPVWAGAIAHEAINLQVGEGDFSAQVVERRGDSVLVFGPVQPGADRQVNYSYVLPADDPALIVPIDQPTAEVNLLVEDTLAAVSAPGLVPMSVQDIEGRRFKRYRTGPLAAGARVVVAFPPAGLRPQQLVPYIALVAAVALVIALLIALRRKPLAQAHRAP